MFFHLALPLSLFASVAAHDAENVVIDYQDLPAGVAPFAAGEEAWIKNKTEYFVLVDVEVPKTQGEPGQAVVILPAEYKFEGEYKDVIFDETEDFKLFKLVRSKPSDAGHGTIGVPRNEVRSGSRKLTYIVRSTRTTFERRYDRAKAKYLTRSATYVGYGVHSILFRAGRSYDPRTGKIYVGKDLRIPRWPGQPVKIKG